MGTCSRACRLLAAAALGATSLAQNAQQPIKRPDAPQPISLGEVSSVSVPSLPAESIGAPLFCGPNGNLMFRLATPAGMEDPVGVSSDGKTVTHFTREKINDIPRPLILSTFLAGSDVYLLVRGSFPLGYQTKWRSPDGEVTQQQASRRETFIVRFGADGNYSGSVHLDVPFQAMRFGAFENGDFLISGTEPSTDEPRTAIVGANGQLRRLLELKGDVHSQRTDAPGGDKDPTALPRFKPADGRPPQAFVTETLRGVVSTSQIVRDGPDLLLFRPINGPVFSISPSGEVRTHKLQIEENSRLYTIKPNSDSWIVEFLHDVPNSQSVEFSTYAFDPKNGVAMREYFFPGDFGWGLACADGNEFTFVMAEEKTNALKLVKLAPIAHN